MSRKIGGSDWNLVFFPLVKIIRYTLNFETQELSTAVTSWYYPSI